MVESKTLVTFSEQETFLLGKELSRELKPGDVISLEGDLGTGKTIITKGIAAGLDITEPITSPTFTLVNTYEGEITLHHFDVYRINDPEELYAIGWDEYFSDDAITVVEWGDRVLEMLPDNTIRIRINRDDEDFNKRNLNIERLSK
ncbi:MAG: tRNA (adenosine(37)-N6)-threonylcarbamoyltransferase complex ATPase subunit type 1 TsaE [Clostridiaceae bacterium]|nr:tRNA (adenosine(37)-N6)-threonylcarbamoyltransferase complex ATPase subunit type 1 TsaE [Clostridiaceae bacterium]